MVSRYAASEVGKYMQERFGFAFTDLPALQPLEDAIWETAREAQLHRRECAAVAAALEGDISYVVRSIEDNRKTVYEPMERGALAERAKATNDLERRVQQLVGVHEATLTAWHQHTARTAEDIRHHSDALDALRKAEALAEGRAHEIASLSEYRDEAEEIITEKDRTIAAAVEELRLGREELETAKAVLEATQRKVNEANKALNQAAVTVADMRSERDEAQKEAHDLREKLDAAEGERDDAEQARRTAVDEYHEAKSDLEDMERQRDEQHERAEGFKTELRETDRKLNAALDRAQEQQNRAEELEEQVDALERSAQAR